MSLSKTFIDNESIKYILSHEVANQGNPCVMENSDFHYNIILQNWL